jgi:hypothetical protein
MNVTSVARILAFTFVLCVGATALADVHGVLRVVKGDVQIKSGKTGQMSKARLGQEVYPKDTIITAKDARAKIVMIDNNEINVSPETNLEIKNYEFNPAENKKEVLLNVLYGKVRSKVEQKYDGKTSKFQVKTPSAVAGVRGTDFVTSFSAATKQTEVTTFRGAVELGLPGPNGGIQNSVSVTPGKSASSTNGAAPTTPTAVPKAQLAKIDKDSNAETATGPRTPSSDKGGGGGKNNNPSSGGNSNSSSTGSSSSAANAAPADTSDRSPASTAGAPAPAASSGGGAILPGDTVGGGGGGATSGACTSNCGGPPPPPPPPPPQPPKPYQPPIICLTCIIQNNGPASLNINVHK